MSTVGSFDRTKGFSELNDPLIGGATGTLTPAQRKAAALANLGAASEAALVAVVALTNSTGVTADDTIANVPAATAALTGADTATLPTLISVNASITAIEADISDLTAKINEILAALS